MTPEEQANRIVLVCARGHSVVTYSAKRDAAAPPCPVCGWIPIPPVEGEEEDQ